ncbi:MAG: hypothetical protein GY753_02855, partial [Gammaproteobacteria bacterium]|nr:hypothetical protein [Gammaproteobacteria bacterium]
KAYGETYYTYRKNNDSSFPQQTGYRYTGQRQEPDIGLYDYRARWYDPALGRFLQADTIVPEPGNPQNLNRYSYVGNNPLKYSDPTGHDLIDALDFLSGFVIELASANAWMSPQAQEALAVQPNEPWPMTAGRHAGNIVAIAQGATEITGGSGMAGGGAAVCLTGALCAAGVPVAAAGVTLVAHGGSVVISGAAQEGELLGNLIAEARFGKSGWTPADARREIGRWKVEKNMNNSDAGHQEAVLRERQGYQYPGYKKDGHIREVQSARKGLNNALGKLNRALDNPRWNDGARAYFLEQQAMIKSRIDLIDVTLYGPIN